METMYFDKADVSLELIPPTRFSEEMPQYLRNVQVWVYENGIVEILTDKEKIVTHISLVSIGQSLGKES